MQTAVHRLMLSSIHGLNFPHTCLSVACTCWGNIVIKLHQKFSLGFQQAQWTSLKCIWQFRYWARSYFDNAGRQKCAWYWEDHYQSGDTLEHTRTWSMNVTLRKAQTFLVSCFRHQSSRALVWSVWQRSTVQRMCVLYILYMYKTTLHHGCLA